MDNFFKKEEGPIIILAPPHENIKPSLDFMLNALKGIAVLFAPRFRLVYFRHNFSFNYPDMVYLLDHKLNTSTNHMEYIHESIYQTSIIIYFDICCPE